MSAGNGLGGLWVLGGNGLMCGERIKAGFTQGWVNTMGWPCRRGILSAELVVSRKAWAHVHLPVTVWAAGLAAFCTNQHILSLQYVCPSEVWQCFPIRHLMNIPVCLCGQKYADIQTYDWWISQCSHWFSPIKSGYIPQVLAVVIRAPWEARQTGKTFLHGGGIVQGDTVHTSLHASRSFVKLFSESHMKLPAWLAFLVMMSTIHTSLEMM